MSEHEVGQAYFDDERVYRYALSRVWDVKKPMLLFVGLNPSTADENTLDPTLRKCIKFAKREGCGGLWVANLFAFRATNPKDMLAAVDPVGPDNDIWLLDIARWCPIILVGWGAHGVHLGRDMQVRKLLQGHTLAALAVNANMTPKHPLYCRDDTPLITYQNVMWRPGR